MSDKAKDGEFAIESIPVDKEQVVTVDRINRDHKRLVDALWNGLGIPQDWLNGGRD